MASRTESEATGRVNDLTSVTSPLRRGRLLEDKSLFVSPLYKHAGSGGVTDEVGGDGVGNINSPSDPLSLEKRGKLVKDF